MKKIASYLFNLLLILCSLLFILSIVYVIIELFSLELNFSSLSFSNFYSIIMKYSEIYYAIILIIPIHLALSNYDSIRKDRADRLKIAKSDFMLSLRKMFSYHDEIHFKLRGNTGNWAAGIPEEDQTNKNFAKIDSYLGLFELCYQMYKNDMLNIDEFNNLYGYRLKNIFNNKDIFKRINLEKEYWQDLLELKAKLKIDTIQNFV